jgi:alpha-1,3/alpha-1,6-mannosyltransferase
MLELRVHTLWYLGGYDPRVGENIFYHSKLVAMCESFQLKHITCKNFNTSLSIPENTDVLFLLSIPASWKTYLLKASSLLLYTPEREHFGIVPLEALLAEVPTLSTCYNRFQLLETLPQRLRNGVCLFNDVTTIF